MLLLALMGLMISTGCGKHEKTPGQALDEALQKTGDAVEKTGKDIKDSAQ